jgi:hypothetical protein
MWACDRCNDNGLVRNWHRTSWNLRATSALGIHRLGDRGGLEITINDRQYALLREGDPLLVIAAAQPQREGRVLLRASPARLEDLLVRIAEYADLETSPSRQRRLFELCDTLQDAMLQAHPRRGSAR